MRSIHSLVTTLAFLPVLGCAAETGVTIYGERPTLGDTTLVSAILADPESFVGQRVLVRGTVVDVCEKRGCWLQLAGDREAQTLRVKVEDGVIIFPLTARGRAALVEGVVEKVVRGAEEAREAARHHAEEQGLPFDSTAAFEPTTTYQLRGVGAIIAD